MRLKSGRASGRPTIADVAREAGVSAITVSRALRDRERVSDDLRARIEAAVAALGYVPDPHARALASARTDVIGVIVPSLSNSVFADVLRGMYDAMAPTRYQIHLGNSRYSAIEEERLLATFTGQKPAALLVSGVNQTGPARRLLEGAGCPVVQIMELGPDPIDMMVGFYQRDAGVAVTRHMMDAGYRRIGFIGARMDPRTFRRLEGYRATLEEAGIYDSGRIVTTTASSSVTMGAQLFRELMAAKPETDAVFCNNDDLALGVLFECQRTGLAVPGRMGIAGFNDLELMAATVPTLTSVRTHRYEMGQRAIGMALAALEGRAVEPRIVDLGFRLEARESTARQKQG